MHKLSTRIKESKDTNGNYLFWKKQRQSGLNRVYIWKPKINQKATYMGETEWAHAKVLFSTGCSAKPKKKFQILFCQCLICSKVNLTSYFAKTLYLAVNQNSKRKEKSSPFSNQNRLPAGHKHTQKKCRVSKSHSDQGNHGKDPMPKKIHPRVGWSTMKATFPTWPRGFKTSCFRNKQKLLPCKTWKQEL